MSSRYLKTASQPEILRSHQKDNDFTSNISETISDLLHRLGKHRTILNFLASEVPAKLIYFIITSGIGNQTLGEEYTGIVQANLTARKVPSLPTRVLAALLECFGEQMLLKILGRLQVSINNPRNELTPNAVAVLNVFLARIRAVIPILILAHRGLFYIYGRYYSIGRRLTGVDYVKVYGARPGQGISWGLRILGFATLAQCLLRFWQNRNPVITVGDTAEIEGTIGDKCQLCLEKSPNTTTPCGHLFCWNCLAEWLRSRSRCPLCRESASPSRIVYLVNL